MTRRPARRLENPDRYQRDVVGPLVGLEATGELAPLPVVGWMQHGIVGGAPRYCVWCRPLCPSPRHVAVYAGSLFALKTCTDCGLRLGDHVG